MKFSKYLIVLLLIPNLGFSDITNPDKPPFLNETAVFLTFEGEIGGLGAECWINRGNVGTGESTSREGTDTVPTITPYGLKGQAFDSSHLEPLTNESTHMYGNFETTPGNGTPMEEAFIDIESFTFTAWVKTQTARTYNPQGRLFKTYTFEINYIQGNIGKYNQYGRLAVRVGSAGFKNTANDYESPDEWVFIGVTYDGTKSVDNLLCYVGQENTPVTLSTVLTADEGILERIHHGGNLWLGNLSNYQAGNRPFVGFMDEFRFWSLKNGNSAVLTLEELETVRKYDLGITKCQGGFYAGDVNFDCHVNIEDLAIVAQSWTQCNRFGDAICY